MGIHGICQRGAEFVELSPHGAGLDKNWRGCCDKCKKECARLLAEHPQLEAMLRILNERYQELTKELQAARARADAARDALYGRQGDSDWGSMDGALQQMGLALAGALTRTTAVREALGWTVLAGEMADPGADLAWEAGLDAAGTRTALEKARAVQELQAWNWAGRAQRLGYPPRAILPELKRRLETGDRRVVLAGNAARGLGVANDLRKVGTAGKRLADLMGDLAEASREALTFQGMLEDIQRQIDEISQRLQRERESCRHCGKEGAK